MSIRKEYTQEDYKSGRSNILANYVPSVLPGIFFKSLYNSSFVVNFVVKAFNLRIVLKILKIKSYYKVRLIKQHLSIIL